MFELIEFYKELSEKYNLTEDQIEEISRSEFKWLMDCMKKKELATIKLIGIGKFTPRVRYKRIKKDENSIECNNRDRDKTRKEEEKETSINKKDV